MILKSLYRFFFFPFRFLFWSVKMIPRYTCTLYLGNKGRGKSVTLAMRCARWRGDVFVPSIDVYNGLDRPEKFGKVHYFSVQHWIQSGCPAFPPNSLVVFDEMGLIANSRRYATFPPQMMMYFKFVRKLKNKVYISSQRPDIDKSIRDLCDNIYLCDRFGAIGIQWRLRPVLGQVVVVTDKTVKPEVIDGYKKARGVPRLVFLPNWFKFLDSNSTSLFGEDKPYWAQYSDSYADKPYFT